MIVNPTFIYIYIYVGAYYDVIFILSEILSTVLWIFYACLKVMKTFSNELLAIRNCNAILMEFVY